VVIQDPDFPRPGHLEVIMKLLNVISLLVIFAHIGPAMEKEDKYRRVVRALKHDSSYQDERLQIFVQEAKENRGKVRLVQPVIVFLKGDKSIDAIYVSRTGVLFFDKAENSMMIRFDSCLGYGRAWTLVRKEVVVMQLD
jgi:hypothetical protein